MNRSGIKKHIPLITKLLFLMMIVLLGYVIIAQTILIPREISRQYNQHLNPGLKQLSTKFNAVSQSTQWDTYNDPYDDVITGRNELLTTQKLIAETEQALSGYEIQAEALPSSPLARTTESYKKAAFIRERSKDVFLQSRDVLDQYKSLTTHLLQVNSARTVLKNNTADVNGLTNLNLLGGQGDIITKRADQIEDTITTLKKSRVPDAFTEYHAQLISSLEQSRASLMQLSSGLNAADDAQINAGAKSLEVTIREYENNGAKLFTVASTNSVILKDASMLSDMIDSLQPFSG